MLQPLLTIASTTAVVHVMCAGSAVSGDTIKVYTDACPQLKQALQYTTVGDAQPLQLYAYTNGTSTVHYNTSELLNSTGLTPVAVSQYGGVTQQLPQSIQFNDQTVSDITVGHNGLIALGGPLPAGEVPGNFASVLSGPSAEPPVLALFWPGISTVCGGSVYMGSTESGVYTVVYDGESPHAANGY
jgi:hypothetical protein